MGRRESMMVMDYFVERLQEQEVPAGRGKGCDWRAAKAWMLGAVPVARWGYLSLCVCAPQGESSIYSVSPQSCHIRKPPIPSLSQPIRYSLVTIYSHFRIRAPRTLTSRRAKLRPETALRSGNFESSQPSIWASTSPSTCDSIPIACSFAAVSDL